MIAAVVALALAAGPRVTVEVLARQAPRALTLHGAGAARTVAARGDALVVDGRPLPGLVLPAGTWRIVLPRGEPHVYEGVLALRAVDGIVRVRAALDLEPYVAGVVASEALPGTPPAALEALAIVVRSYALAAPGRHGDGALCDLAHCQLLRAGGIAPAHRAAARRAARATRGAVLVLPSGATAAATFHAACGGHTADPREVFGSAAGGGEARPDPGCAGPEWRAALTPQVAAAAIRRALAGDPRAAAAVPPAIHAGDLVLRPGPGGWVGRVEARDGSWRLSGDAFARALDAAAGRGRIRSGRFALGDAGGAVELRGTGHGHGVGLCQAGAARRAREGEGRHQILAHFFPGAEVRRAPHLEAPSAGVPAGAVVAGPAADATLRTTLGTGADPWPFTPTRGPTSRRRRSGRRRPWSTGARASRRR